MSTHFAFSVADSLEEARRRAEAFARLPGVASVRSAATLLPEPAPGRGDALRRLAAVLEAGRDGVPGPSGPEELRHALDGLEATLLEAQDLAFEGGRDAIVTAVDGVLASLERARQAVGDPGAAAGLEEFRQASARQLGRIAARTRDLAVGPLEATDLPPELASQLVGRAGGLAVVIEPRGSIWDRDVLEDFVAQLRTVDPDVTGPPVSILEVTGTMRESLQAAALLAFAIISVIVAWSMRSVMGCVVALAPLLAGFVLMLGAMVWLHVPLNPANLVALPLLLGIGVDTGVHVAHRFLIRGDVEATVREVGHAVAITGLTTIAGFAGLLLASHRGIRTLGVLACLGTLAMLLTSLVLLPACLKLREGRRTRP